MNMKNVIISISGTQSEITGEQEKINLVTAGKYEFEGGQGHFTYDESTLTGLPGTRTTFTISPLGVVLRREGTMNAEMVFQQGRKNFFMYETPFGAATMGIDTHRIQMNLGEHGGDLELDYDIDFNHSHKGHNQFIINVRENVRENQYGRSN